MKFCLLIAVVKNIGNVNVLQLCVTVAVVWIPASLLGKLWCSSREVPRPTLLWGQFAFGLEAMGRRKG